jgi:MFS family permease
MEASPAVAETKVPARLDRLPWSRWHWLVVAGLGTVWILDGLEVTIVGTVAAVLTEKGSGLELTASQVGQAAALYVTGACIGALFFARLTDKHGRKKLFMITLAVYLLATIATAFSQSFVWFAAMRFFTGAGIGGEYAAINSAIDELIPARVRGTVDLIINGSFWLGTAAGALLSVVLLDPSLFAKDVGWRVAFGAGFVLGIGVLIIRRYVPESPRWLFLHGRDDEAEAIVDDIEEQVKESTGRSELPEPGDSIKVAQRGTIGLWQLARTIFADYRQRAIVGFSLFLGQAFLYNAVFFTYALVLSTFFKIDGDKVGFYILPFAVGNFLGPLVLGRLFDTVGRKPMIAGSYIVSGLLLIVTGFLFTADVFGAWGLTAAWAVIFFFASAGASSAYLTVSEIFPMETRAMSIALFYAVGTAAGGIIGPLLFGKLVESGDEMQVFWGWVLASALMIGAGLVQAFLGVAAEQRGLEDIAKPVSAEEVEEEHPDEAAEPARERKAPPPRRARHRLGPGEGQAIWSPRFSYGSRMPVDTEVQREVDALVSAIEARGEINSRELRALAESRYWGPGRFRRALRSAIEDGRIEPAGRGRFRPTRAS